MAIEDYAESAIITNIKTGFRKILFDDDFSKDEWNKIKSFYSKHKNFAIQIYN